MSNKIRLLKWSLSYWEAWDGPRGGLFLPRVSDGVFLIAFGYGRSELHQRFLALAISDSRSAIKGPATESLRVNRPPLDQGNLGTVAEGLLIENTLFL